MKNLLNSCCKVLHILLLKFFDELDNECLAKESTQIPRLPEVRFLIV